MLFTVSFLIMDDIDSGDGGAARAREIGSIGVSTPWKPVQLVFKRYLPQKGSESEVPAAVKKPVSIDLLFWEELCKF